MSFRDCVEAAVKAGGLSREQAEDLYLRQRDAQDRFTLDLQHSPESAERLAQELGIERAKQDVRLKKYQAALQAIRNSENATSILSYQHGPTLGVRTLLARDSRGVSRWENVETLARGILGQAHAKMAEGISQLRTRWLGFQRDTQLLHNSVREAFGEATGDANAKAFARAWGETAEALRQRFNRAGGSIPRRADWGLPQVHDSVRVGQASKAEWVDFITQRLDIERMTDVETGAAFTPDALDMVLQGVYETIRTNGVSDMLPGAAAGGKKLANRRQDSRFLVFKDADSWLEYQERFGSDNLFGTMMDHLRGMSRDIALLEVMGPNPAASFRYLQDVARMREDRPIARATNEAVFRLVNGSGDANRSPFAAHFFGAIRSWNVAASLGAAALSAVSDLSFIRATAKWNGLPVTKTLTRYLSQLNPANEADRILATRIGITAFGWTDAYSNVGRFAELEGTGGGRLARISHAGSRFAETVLRASGLNAMSDAGRRAFAMEFSANIAENFSRGLKDIEGPLGQSLERALTPEDWEVLRATPTTDHKGAKFFTVDQLMAREDLPLSKREELAAKVQGLINEEILYAVPEPDALAKVVTTAGGAQRGTIVGETARTLMQFKSFPVAMLSLHVQRMLHARALRGGAQSAAYAANVIIGTTVLGMLALQLKLIARGKDPRDMDDPKVWAAAFAQGGGAGIFGDFFFADANRFGQGITSTLLGPTAGMVDAAWKTSWGNVQQAMKGEDTNLAADVVGFASRYTPGGSLWYTRLVLEREIFDQLATAADPSGARRRFNRAERKARDEGTGYWWQPGETAPDRAPQIGE